MTAHGVRFPEIDGARSSSRTGAAIVADALAETDSVGAESARAEKEWRSGYGRHFVALTRTGADGDAAARIAADGLAATHRNLVYVDEHGESPLDEWARTASDPEPPQSEEIAGQQDRLDRIEVPYRGQTLSGDTLRRQLDNWVADGIVEVGFADAIRQVQANPEWLSLPGHRVVLLGAGAAMGPFEALSRWGADIVAIDVPDEGVADRLRETARAGAGRVILPVTGSGPAGLDLAAELPAARAWLRSLDTDPAVPIVATETYADGARHVEVNAACDVLAADVVGQRDDAILAFLHTPTDVFLVPEGAVAQAHERAREFRWNGPAHRAAKVISRGRLMEPAYPELVTGVGGRMWGVSDTVVPVQGPNYLLAKRLQRWRAMDRHRAGGRVSSTVAPASWTRSVTKNRMLAAAYAGAGAFGVEVFAPETARALLAAKLVADVFRGQPDRRTDPEALFLDAAHGGLWRQPFEPRSALTLAALFGLPRTVRPFSRER